MSTYESMTGSELLAEYNKIAEQLNEPIVKRFADRKSAIRRLTAIKTRFEETVEKECERASEELFAQLEAPVVEAPVVEAPKKPIAPGRGRKTRVDLTRKVTIVVDPMRPTNPKRKGTRAWDIFELYGSRPIRGDVYLRKVREAGYTQKLAIDSLRWDLDHGFVVYYEPNEI